MDILIVGVGGQGTVLASKVLGKYAMNCGYDCKLSEVHGMSQRGGSVVTHVRFSEKVYSPVVDAGHCDAILAFELLEAERYVHFLKTGGIVLVNDRRIFPMPVITGAEKYPESPETDIKSKAKAYFSDAYALAEKAGSGKAMNVVLLGEFCRLVGLDREKFLTAVLECVPERFTELNKNAFNLGYESEDIR